MPKLPTLGYKYDAEETELELGAGVRNITEPTLEEKYAPYPPFASTEEVYIWSVIHPIDPYWTTQVTFGNPRVAGSTRVDFQNEPRRISLFADGLYFHNKSTAADAIKRAGVTGLGYRVLVFTYTDLEDCIARFPSWYEEYIG
jgi:hypothetical protein